MRSFELVGVQIQAVEKREALSLVRTWLQDKSTLRAILTPNPEILFNAQRDPRLMRALSRGSLLIPDGIGIVLAAKMKGIKEIHRLTGIDLAEAILREIRPKTYLLGAKPGVSDRAAEVIRSWDVPVEGLHHGYFQEDEVPALLDKINRSGAEFLLLALGSPRQELFLDAHFDKLQLPVAMVVGGSFDVWAGDKKRAPVPFRRLGLEWVWRTLHEPERIGRLWPLVVFLWQTTFGDRSRPGS